MSRCAALAFACGTAHDLVCVPLTEKELAPRSGCSPGTGTRYLRRRGSAVVVRRYGIVFSPPLVTRQASAANLALPPVPVDRELLESFDRPALDSTCVELLVGDSPTLRPSIQDLATQLGINRSTAHRHLSAVEGSSLARSNQHLPTSRLRSGFPCPPDLSPTKSAGTLRCPTKGTF